LGGRLNVVVMAWVRWWHEKRHRKGVAWAAVLGSRGVGQGQTTRPRQRSTPRFWRQDWCWTCMN
jgi:hypothetical protein